MSDDTPFSSPPHETFMRLALREAQAALDEDEVPIGAVVVHDHPSGGAARSSRRPTTCGSNSTIQRPTPR
jgi:tRNA(Arg) A34 adenosine deaminase TadA